MATQQVPSRVLMIRPHHFASNPETAASNAFQDNTELGLSEQARHEFDRALRLLEEHLIEVIVVDDTDLPRKPDAVFPNNWLTTHADGTIVLYPMMAPSRRLERRPDIVEQLQSRLDVTRVIDLSQHENQGNYLEGTGSIVFDHEARLAFACRSPRTHESVLQELCAQLEYKPVLFDAIDQNGKAIYHTNVMMWVGRTIAGVCLDAIPDEADQEMIIDLLSNGGHRIVAISYKQMSCFAGNMLEVANRKGEPYLLLSQTAFDSLLPGQLSELQKHCQLLPVSIPTIEKGGGGSIRCMVAGIHLPEREIPT